MNAKPIIAVTMGDPAGIGPEIAVKALSKASTRRNAVPFVIGDAGVLLRAALWVKGVARVEPIQSVDALDPASDAVQVLDLANVDIAGMKLGTVSGASGRAAGQAIEEAVRLALAHKIDGIATAPIQKESFKAAGYPYPGHTEMLAALSGAKHFALMLMVDQFRVVHVTLHAALKDAVKAVTREKVYDTIRVAHEGCRTLGLHAPRIAVAGLNPHAGEGGLFGDEEARFIAPAVAQAKGEGIEVEGPFSADTVFSQMRGGRYDIVVAMTHDQGGIPMKLLAFEWDGPSGRWGRIRGVNVTLGLSIIRTSVSHGTGFEIAGKGTADPTSLEEAIETASLMARLRPGMLQSGKRVNP